MLRTKLLEIRDRNTMIPALAVEMIEPQGECCLQSDAAGRDARLWLLAARCGYRQDKDHPTILLTYLDGGRPACADPYDWGDRTMKTAHVWITEHWHELKDGDVVCVEHILGERETPKISERLDRYDDGRVSH